MAAKEHNLPLADRVERLQEMQVQRRGAIRAKNRLISQMTAIVRRALGWSVSLSEAERKRINGRAQKIISVFLDGERDDDAANREIVGALFNYLTLYREMLRPSWSYIHETELAMCRVARTLPGYSYVKATKGFGEKTFAIIVGEAGDLSNYPDAGVDGAKAYRLANPNHYGPPALYKRLGLAPITKDGQTRSGRMWRIKGGLTKDDWTEAGYSPERRAEVYAQLGTSLIKAQGPAKDLYDARKAYEAKKAPDEPKMAHHMRAMRYVEKRLLRDLWRAWRDEAKATQGLPEMANSPLRPPRPSPYSVVGVALGERGGSKPAPGDLVVDTDGRVVRLAAGNNRATEQGNDRITDRG